MKSRMKKSVRSIIIVLVIIWFASGRIKIHRWNVALPQAAITNAQVAEHMSGLQNITGTLLIFPWAFSQFSSAFGQTKSWLQMRKYEFTEPLMKA